MRWVACKPKVCVFDFQLLNLNQLPNLRICSVCERAIGRGFTVPYGSTVPVCHCLDSCPYIKDDNKLMRCPGSYIHA